MTPDHLGLMAATVAAALLLAAFLGWRGGNARADVALMGGSGAVLGAASALLMAT